MTASLKPALSQAEWDWPHGDTLYKIRALAEFLGAAKNTPNNQNLIRQWRHQLAALALHDLPEGFSREDVELLEPFSVDPRFRNLSERIRALLPP